MGSALDRFGGLAEVRVLMSDKAQNVQADRIRRRGGIISGLCLAGAAGSMLYAGVTRNFGMGVVVFFGALWTFFVTALVVALLTGEFRVRGGFAVNRARHPGGFYFVTILAALLTVAPLSFVLWLAVRRVL